MISWDTQFRARPMLSYPCPPHRSWSGMMYNLGEKSQCCNTGASVWPVILQMSYVGNSIHSSARSMRNRAAQDHPSALNQLSTTRFPQDVCDINTQLSQKIMKLACVTISEHRLLGLMQKDDRQIPCALIRSTLCECTEKIRHRSSLQMQNTCNLQEPRYFSGSMQLSIE